MSAPAATIVLDSAMASIAALACPIIFDLVLPCSVVRLLFLSIPLQRSDIQQLRVVIFSDVRSAQNHYLDETLLDPSCNL